MDVAGSCLRSHRLRVWWNRSIFPWVWGGGFKGCPQFLGELKRLVSTGEVARWEDHA